MHAIGRQISLFGRRRDSVKDCRRVLRSFSEWRSLQSGLPPPRRRSKTLLLIRLDDIGDYLLFRNQLRVYRASSRWSDHRITLLGNASWRDLNTLLDHDAVDDAIWVNKNQYLEDAAYRSEVWQQLRQAGFETVIAPACTRPLLLDDLCMLAAAPLDSRGSVNSNVHASWNKLSDGLYTALFAPSRPLLHEFIFNGEFAAWASGIRYAGSRPWIEKEFSAPVAGPYVICFVGASTRSRRWPVKRWIEFITLYRREFAGKVFLAGNGKAEAEMVRIIHERTGALRIEGTLTALLGWVAGAEAVISNDTMAAHMGVSLGRPTVIVANGINYMRFSNYANAGIDGVRTIYPEFFNRRRERQGEGLYAYSDTVSADIACIAPQAVMQGLRAVLPRA